MGRGGRGAVSDLDQMLDSGLQRPLWLTYGGEFVIPSEPPVWPQPTREQANEGWDEARRVMTAELRKGKRQPDPRRERIYRAWDSWLQLWLGRASLQAVYDSGSDLSALDAEERLRLARYAREAILPLAWEKIGDLLEKVGERELLYDEPERQAEQLMADLQAEVDYAFYKCVNERVPQTA